MAPRARRPRPGSANTDSSTMAPAISWPSCRPATVTIGISAFRRVCLPTHEPLAHALGPRGAHVVLAQHVEHGRARGAHQHRGLEEARARRPAGAASAAPARRRPTSRRSRRSGTQPSSPRRTGSAADPPRTAGPRSRAGRRSSPGSRRRAGDGWPRRRPSGIAVERHEAGGQQRQRQRDGQALRIRRRPAGRTGSSGPRSPRSARPSQSTYCTASGRFSPIASRRRSVASGLPSVPMMSAAGSPGRTRTTTKTSSGDEQAGSRRGPRPVRAT